MGYPIIVHCHLRWEGVWQRPQQFLSRLSLRHPVLFAEGPILVDNDSLPRYFVREAPGWPGVRILQMELPRSRFPDGQWVDAKRLELLQAALDGPLRGEFKSPVQWFYDPMAVTAFLGQVGEIANVYDCMDELSQFKFAPPEIRERERLLLEKADVVFTGGRRMYLSKSRFNRNCHFYGCGVDVAHFAKARLEETPLPQDISAIPKPILGYFGVVDERMDYTLIARLAESNPDWSIVIIGPVAKVDPAQFPRFPNLHWLGRREYPELPNYTKAFDVCLMPFALNEATEYINPTKALEYMAAGKPIVSSAVPDVVSNFGSVVKIASSAEEFSGLCRACITNPDMCSIARGLELAENNQWESIVEKLEQHVDEVIKRKAEVKSRRDHKWI